MPTWTSNIPSQVKTYANVSAFPATGSVKTIYIAEDTDIAYYWTGSAYQSISIQDLSGLVPYTGATSDVDLGNNDLNAEGIKIKGTAGNGHLNLKHQSSNPSAGGQETVIFAGSDGEPRFKNDGNAVEQFASREWVGLQGFQNTPIVVNANITAQNDRVYHVVANATFTDPTGVEGRGYVVVVRGATATIGGNTGGAGTINYRLFHSGSWTTYQFWNINQLTNVFVPQTRTINGLDLTANRTLTTANINDSTNRRYVTDAQLTVIGNTSGTNTGDQDLSGLMVKVNNLSDLTNAATARTNLGLGTLATQNGTFSGTSSGTNTGDETQTSILSKLGWWNILNQTAGTVSSGTTNTITKSIALPSVPSVLNFRAVFSKTGGNGTFTVRAYLSDVDNNIGGTAILIGTITSTAGNVTYLPMKRTTDFIGGNAIGLNASQTALTDDFQSATVRLNTAYPTGTPLYLIFAVQCTSASDSARFESCMINNFTF